MQTYLAACKRGWGQLMMVVLLMSGGQLAAGQPMRDLVDAALDQKISSRVEIAEQPIRSALAELEKVTGLRFGVDEMAIEWMPYGDETRIAITLADVSVRSALTRILDGLGLSLRVDGGTVVIEPAPWLDRLGRRLTADEVELLGRLAAGPWSGLKADEVRIKWRQPSNFKAGGMPEPSQEPATTAMLVKELMEAQPDSALRQLEGVCRQHGWCWLPEGKSVVVLPEVMEVMQRMDRPMDLSYRRVALDELLLDLGKRAGVTVKFAPGVLQRVQARDRNVDLVQRGMSMNQALQLIGGNTGLYYELRDNGILISAPKAPGGVTLAGDDLVVAVLRVPVGSDGTTIDFLIRADELPEEFRRLKERKMPAIIELLRKSENN